jgi:hypothetical protein
MSQWDQVPLSSNVEDRRNSLVDALLTQLRYPMRRDWAQYQRFGDPEITFPRIAADFPSAPAGYAEPDSGMARALGIRGF